MYGISSRPTISCSRFDLKRKDPRKAETKSNKNNGFVVACANANTTLSKPTNANNMPISMMANTIESRTLNPCLKFLTEAKKEYTPFKNLGASILYDSDLVDSSQTKVTDYILSSSFTRLDTCIHISNSWVDRCCSCII